MKIGMVCHNYPPHPGGLEAMVSQIASRLVGRDSVVVVSTEWNGEAGVATEGGLEIHRLRAVHASERHGVPYPVPIGPGVWRALRALRRVDVLHAHGSLYPTTLLALEAAREAQLPLVVTEHVGFVSYRQRWLNLLQVGAWAGIGNRVLRSADALTALNGRVAQWMQQRTGRAVRFIGNGVDVTRFRPRFRERQLLREELRLPIEGVLALFVGRDNPKKNLASVLALRRDNYTLVVCGGGERDRNGLGVVNLGLVPREQMPQVYAACDFLIHAASGEGFPLAVQEAMASGLPVVLHWDSGYADSLDRDIVAACGDIASMADAILNLASDPAERTRLGMAARHWAETHWSWGKTVDEYRAVYDDCSRRYRMTMSSPDRAPRSP